jgi:hypothetical protein
VSFQAENAETAIANAGEEGVNSWKGIHIVARL